MALISLLTGNLTPRTKFQSGVDGSDLFVVDAVLSITAEHEAEATENPVEDGADITDHIRVKPIKLSLEGIASETPINLGASLLGAASIAAGIGGSYAVKKYTGASGKIALGGKVAGAVAGIGLNALFNSKTPAETCREFLIGLVQSRNIFKLWTPQKRYDNLVMLSVKFPKDQKTGRALRFSAQMREIVIAKSQSVRLDNVDTSVLHTAPKTSDLGRKSAGSLTSEASSKSSLLYSGIQSVGGWK